MNDDNESWYDIIKRTIYLFIFIIINIVIIKLFTNPIKFYLKKILESTTSFGIAITLEGILVAFIILKKIMKKNSYIYDIIKDINNSRLKLKKEDERILNIKDVSYNRDILFNGDVFKTYWLLYQYNLLGDSSDLIGALLLKWIKEDKISVINGGNILFDKNYDNIDSNKEKELLEILFQSAGSDKILENGELKKWMKQNKTFLSKWFNSVLEEQNILAEKQGLVYKKNNKKYILKIVNNDVNELLGLKKFLIDYSLIHEKYPIEINLWEDYLIFAQVLGIADKVRAELKKLYPNSKEINKNDSISNSFAAKTLKTVLYISCFANGYGIAILLNFWIFILYKIILFIEEI